MISLSLFYANDLRDFYLLSALILQGYWTDIFKRNYYLNICKQ